MDYKHKTVAILEMAVMLVSLFAFSYIVGSTNHLSSEVESQLKQVRKERVTLFEVVLLQLASQFKKPMIPMVSASEPIPGCCALSTQGEVCSITTEEQCGTGEAFASYATCESTSFCQRGCCYHNEQGIFDRHVLEQDCSTSNGWVWDGTNPTCDLPAADLGCCVLGTQTVYETFGQCKVDTELFGLGQNAQPVWDATIDELGCLALSYAQEEGACVLHDGSCKFSTGTQCSTLGGDFALGVLCTHEGLDTACEPTTNTMCVEGRDGVYFQDSCGNPANIYDANRVDDSSYWQEIVSVRDSCGADSQEGNADSTSCGNCDRFFGGICSSTKDSGINAEHGQLYCKQTSCVDGAGNTYRNGESWCAYDGKIGDGDDLPGSRHFRYTCNYGEIELAGCSDQRGQICIQSNQLETVEGEVDFRTASCVINAGKACFTHNGEESDLEDCNDALHCEIREVDIGSHFKFEYCAPKYPIGFGFDVTAQEATATLCSQASTTCQVVYQPKVWGGCELIANGDCLTEEFTQKMNDYCRGLGDCGASPNPIGVYTENFKVAGAPLYTNEWVNTLKALARPVPGQMADVEDYSSYLEAAGFTTDSPDGEGIDVAGPGLVGAIGVAGIVYAGYSLGIGAFAAPTFSVVSGSTITALSSSGQVVFQSSTVSLAQTGTVLTPFAGVAIGAAVGAAIGFYLGKELGVSPGGTILMAIGGAIVGGALGYAVLVGFSALGPVGWAIIAIGLIIFIIGALFGGDSCEPIDVEFTCEPWQPPRGGNDCDLCNGDPLRPCTQYRCKSLGAACEFINQGTANELCIDNDPNDVTPPVISLHEDFDAWGGISAVPTATGIELTSESSTGCLQPYTDLTLSLQTSEAAQCKYDSEPRSFSEMRASFGLNAYLIDHRLLYPLLDPSHGQSRGIAISEEARLYVTCADTHGIESIGFFTIDYCIHEGIDKQPPVIKKILPESESITGVDSENRSVSIFTSEAATCKYDANNVAYESMGGAMTCPSSFSQRSSLFGYECFGDFATPEPINTYYVLCADQPWLVGTANESTRNIQFEPTTYTLIKPETKIAITSVEPQGTLESGTFLTSITLDITTSGGGTWHKCEYSFSGFETMIELFETGLSTRHTQPLTLPAGTHDLYVRCRDETGDISQTQTSFTIDYDGSSPQIARVWQTDKTLYLITHEEAQCRYSTQGCGFSWENATSLGSGLLHSFQVKRGDTYAVRCEDIYGNAPTGCSISVSIP